MPRDTSFPHVLLNDFVNMGESYQEKKPYIVCVYIVNLVPFIWKKTLQAGWGKVTQSLQAANDHQGVLSHRFPPPSPTTSLRIEKEEEMEQEKTEEFRVVEWWSWVGGTGGCSHATALGSNSSRLTPFAAKDHQQSRIVLSPNLAISFFWPCFHTHPCITLRSSNNAERNHNTYLTDSFIPI